MAFEASIQVSVQSRDGERDGFGKDVEITLHISGMDVLVEEDFKRRAKQISTRNQQIENLLRC